MAVHEAGWLPWLKRLPSLYRVWDWEEGPEGSKDPNNRVLGPKYYRIHGIWTLKPSYLGPWTLRGVFSWRLGLWQSGRVGLSGVQYR